MVLSPQTLAKITNGVVHHESTASVGLPSIDTRTLEHNDSFYALHGPRFDGHDFIDVALDQGAGTLVIHHDRAQAFSLRAETHCASLISVDNTEIALQQVGAWYRSQFGGGVVGITGSSGKTTTKEMLRTALSAHGTVVATHGNLNNHLGVPLSLSQLTSEPDFAVFEMGMNAPGEISTLSQWVCPDVAIITSIGEAHLEGVGSLEGVAHAKCELFEALNAQTVAICPSNVPFFEYVEETAGSKLRTVGAGVHDTCRIMSQRVEGSYSLVEFSVEKQAYHLSLPCIGAHHISNALCALMAVRGLGLPLAPSIEALSHFELPAMRGQRFKLHDGIEVSLDCYNANPQSMRAAIEAHIQQGTKRSVLILGDMLELGAHSQGAHESLGQYLNLDFPEVFVIAVGEEMRHCFDALNTVDQRKERVIWSKDAESAAQALKAHLGSNMNILIKGSRGLKLETVWHQLKNLGV